MKVSGFSFIRNAVKYSYPIVEAIKSILPICDKFYIAVGKSDDGTLELIEQLDPDKVIIINTEWDDSLREGGKVLACETNKAFQAIENNFDWAFYIQGDEIVHEKYLPVIKDEMERWKDDDNVDGLLFNYLHFYGSYSYVADSEKWYSKEVRIIKNNKKIYSYKDAQGFRKGNNEKLRVKWINAFIYHYGWVKPPDIQKKKVTDFHRLWHSDQWIENNCQFDYSNIDSLKPFKGSHPSVIQPMIECKNWTFEHDLSKNRNTIKSRLKRIVKIITGIEIGYKNYKII
jgi:hypothetical protein